MADILVELKEADTPLCRRAIAEIERLRSHIAADDRSAFELCASIAGEVAQETADGEGEIYIARRIADKIRSVR